MKLFSTVSIADPAEPLGFDTLCYTLQHRPRLQDEGGKGYSTQIRAGPQLRYDVHEHWRCSQ